MKLLQIIISLLVCFQAGACELWIKAVSFAHPDATKDSVGRTKRGMVVQIRPDGSPYGSSERLPNYVVIKIPGVKAGEVSKYLEPQLSAGSVSRARVWQIRLDDLSETAKQKLSKEGELVVKAGKWDGKFDYTWEDFQPFIQNLETGLPSTGAL
jgi:hypothetical protein